MDFVCKKVDCYYSVGVSFSSKIVVHTVDKTLVWMTVFMDTGMSGSRREECKTSEQVLQLSKMKSFIIDLGVLAINSLHLKQVLHNE